ncbi:MAG: RHS repeat domain-containing protein [Cyclobacteriaceae bacterium]
MRGLPDETTAGYNGAEQNGLKAVNFVSNGTNPQGFENYLTGIMNGAKDGEPDMFILSAPGLSGRFFFDETQCGVTVKQAVVSPHQNLKVFGYFNYSGIYNIRPGIIEKFLVIDERGVQYTFDITEKAAGLEPGDPDEADFATSWYLSKIESPNGNIVTYTYKFRVLDMPPSLFERRVVPFSNDPNAQFTDLYTLAFNSTSTNEAILERIDFRNGSVEFVEGNERLDWNSEGWNYSKRKATEQPKSLSKVRVRIDGVMLKEINFNYDYFESNARLKLESFQEINGTTVKPPHRFEYLGGLFPIIGNEYNLFHQDHWGYFLGTSIHGEAITTLLPPYTNAIPKPDGSMIIYSVPGNLRTANSNFSRAGLLQRITYPTGGFTEFEYESNDYWGEPEFNICGGEFQQTGTAGVEIGEGDLNDSFTFTVSGPTCIKFDYDLQTPCLDGEAGVDLTMDGGGAPIMQHIQTKYQWGIDYVDSGAAENELFSLSPGNYTIRAWVINENNCGSMTKSRINLFQIIQDSLGAANLTAGGNRVKTMRDCNDENDCVTKHYSYRDPLNPNQSSGVIVNPPIYQHYQLVRFDGESAGGQTNYVDFMCSILTAQSEIPIATTSGSVIGYKYVNVLEEIDSSKGRSEFHFTAPDDYPDAGITSYPFPPLSSNDWQRGLQLSKSDFGIAGSEEKILSHSESTPCITSHYSRSIAFKLKKTFDTRGSYSLTLQDYEFTPYQLQSGWQVPCTEQQFQYSYKDGQQQSLSSNQEMFYENDAHLRVTRIETTNSKGQQLKTTFKYIEDVGDIAGLTSAEITGITAHPNKTAVVEQQSFVDGQLHSTKRNIYNGIDLVKVQSATGNNALEDYVTYNEYDNWGNVVNYTTRMGDNKSYLWTSDGMYPLAEASNAAPTDIFFTSFESGGVLFSDANGNNLALSGMRVLNSGSYVFPASFNPSDPSNILMSYWYWENNKWNFSGEIPYNATITTSGTKLDEIRAFPKGAQMATLNHDPGFGVTGVTDPNNQSMHYEYDLLGRLILIRDHDGNILKEYKYHYNGQN